MAPRSSSTPSTPTSPRPGPARRPWVPARSRPACPESSGPPRCPTTARAAASSGTADRTPGSPGTSLSKSHQRLLPGLNSSGRTNCGTRPARCEHPRVLSLMNGLETLARTEAASYETGPCRSRCPLFFDQRNAQQLAFRGAVPAYSLTVDSGDLVVELEGDPEFTGDRVRRRWRAGSHTTSKWG